VGLLVVVVDLVVVVVGLGVVVVVGGVNPLLHTEQDFLQ